MHYHIVGIAGAGMSAMAHILLDQGHTISGSDLQSNRMTMALTERGATIYTGHDPAHIEGAEALLATAAVPPDHPEVEAARQADIPLLKRGDLWRDWSGERTTIAVAGTHGKTTTTALLAWVFSHAGRNPGFLIGGESYNLGMNARWGDPAAPLIIEADEYDRAFLALKPHVAIVTNVEWDHPDVYASAEEYYQAFASFTAEADGVVVACGDTDVGLWSREAEQIRLPIITYGLGTHNDYQASVLYMQLPVRFHVHRAKKLPHLVHDKGGEYPADYDYQLNVPGTHNVRNALAVILVAEMFGLDAEVVAEALREFRGTARRFETKGEIAPLLGETRGVTVVDDYAHHPAEVRATLEAARKHLGGRRTIVYVQPHTYSRTRALLNQWTTAFNDADVILVGAIYAAREQREGSEVDELTRQLVAGIAEHHHDVTYVGEPEQATTIIRHILRPGDVVLTLGAGDSNRVGEMLLEQVRV